jgi:hypothetical protein
MCETLRLIFGTSGDIRKVTAFVARIRTRKAQPRGSFPSRETEAVIRACLGEVGLLDAVPPDRFSYPEIGITVLSQLFDEWQPNLPQIRDIFERTEKALELALEYIPELTTGEEDWFAAGMDRSPFAVYLGRSAQPDAHNNPEH